MGIDWSGVRSNPMANDIPSFRWGTYLELARRVSADLSIWGVADDVNLTIIRVAESESVIAQETRAGTVLTYVNFTPGSEVLFTVRNPIYVEHLLNRVFVEVEQVVLDLAMGVDGIPRATMSQATDTALNEAIETAAAYGDQVSSDLFGIVRSLSAQSAHGITLDSDTRIMRIATDYQRLFCAPPRGVNDLSVAIVACIEKAENDNSETSDVLLGALRSALAIGAMQLTEAGLGIIGDAVTTIRTNIAERQLDSQSPMRDNKN